MWQLMDQLRWKSRGLKTSFLHRIVSIVFEVLNTYSLDLPYYGIWIRNDKWIPLNLDNNMEIIIFF